MEAQVLRELYSSPGWRLHSQGIREKLASHYRALVNEKDPFEIARHQGRIKGLEEALNLREVFFPKRGGRGQ